MRYARITRKLPGFLLAGLIGAACSPGFAAVYDVTIDTTDLTGTDAYLAFDLIDGDSVTANNTATISNFLTDATLGMADSTGGVSGTLPGTVTITDTDAFNELLQAATLASSISFRLDLTENNPGDSVPDQFSFFLLNSDEFPLYSTDDPTGTDAVFAADIFGPGSVELYVFTPTSSPAASTSVTVVPLPPAILLFLTGVSLLALNRRRAVKN